MVASGPKICTFSLSDNASTAFSNPENPSTKALVKLSLSANLAAKSVALSPPVRRFPLFLAPFAFPSFTE